MAVVSLANHKWKKTKEDGLCSILKVNFMNSNFFFFFQPGYSPLLMKLQHSVTLVSPFEKEKIKIKITTVTLFS